MASKETAVVNAIMKDMSPLGVRLFRNVRGNFYTLDSVRALIAAVRSMNKLSISVAIQNLRQLAAGLLAPGASDLIGFTPVVITQDMVGQKIAVFCAVECKTETARPSPEQLHFCDFIRKSGGLAGIARSPEDARKILVDFPHVVR